MSWVSSTDLTPGGASKGMAWTGPSTVASPRSASPPASRLWRASAPHTSLRTTSLIAAMPSRQLALTMGRSSLRSSTVSKRQGSTSRPRTVRRWFARSS
eukprot:scaffold117728_cov111-Phaeocystis_antarctica.AAC.1